MDRTENRESSVGEKGKEEERTLEKTVSVERVGRVAVPASVFHAQETELLRNLGRSHGWGREEGMGRKSGEDEDEHGAEDEEEGTAKKESGVKGEKILRVRVKGAKRREVGEGEERKEGEDQLAFPKGSCRIPETT
jgi:hypothetical protein